MSPNNRIRAAEGYYELKMPDQAWRQIGRLTAEQRKQAPVLGLRIQLHLDAEQWSEALALSRQLLDVQPYAKGAYIHAAYCLHELQRTDEARDLLLEAPEELWDEAVYYYNLACYEARVGDLETAREWLERSFRMDPALVRHAREDPDLSGLWSDSGTVQEADLAE